MSVNAPSGEYGAVWQELTGYVQQARDEGTMIDPTELLAYMAELKQRALAPITRWLERGSR
jgi:hypothetical protein